MSASGAEVAADILVVGGGLGGVAAALAAARSGRRVLLAEEYPWLGGQSTSQAVPPDEHGWMERFGGTRTYGELREGVREYYRRWYPLTARARADRRLNPGLGRVSGLCHEPRVSVAVIEGMLAPWRAAGRLEIRLRHRPVAATTDGDRVTSVTLRDLDSGAETVAVAPWVIDATETGELLPLTGTEYVTGFESQGDTGEPSAPQVRQPLNMQAASWCFAIDHVDGDHTIDRPDDYDHWRGYRPDYWPGPMLGLLAPHPHTLEPRQHYFHPNTDADAGFRSPGRPDPDPDELWTFRRILAQATFEPGTLHSDVTLVNWPMIDYVEGPLFEVGEEESARHIRGAKRQALSFFYWLQTQAPRPDGGTGFPGLRLRPDITGTPDGFAQAPYIRESRRIAAEYTVVEQDVSRAERAGRGIRRHADSVGIGFYRLDLHPSSGGDNYIDLRALPFEIPLGALLPVRMRNLLPAAKNIGTTHITNGCYRLHPVEWNIGESAGLLAAHALGSGVDPREVRSDERRLRDFQRLLTAEGIDLSWPAPGLD
ncbi:FAD-dependent oxidoreductase [Occultella kanbiaonis]|uniref:FAD-dependent oxidoreductase n=1 Tax=Occultella kanbiaonis TaxID=2675754 RepID=UPI0013D40B93|nr:FAD-dependent oxidoreductase [Occultella kanbiaonis]